ncbi:MAG: cobalamin biosynthesis protein CobD [Candidatus Methanomethylophilaceae archaeon]|nr:cobalamin biosynthesis protein CobD [Candidatus Methanomethylophilaceae archaeon]
MELWMDALSIIVLAILIDRFIGDVPNSIHPLRWMGNLLDAIDRRIKNRSTAWTSMLGFLSYLLVFLLFGGIAIVIITAVHYFVSQYDETWGEIAWIVVTAFIFKVQFAIFSFRHHCDPICEDLDAGRIEDAASKVQMIVSRNTKGMDAEHIASSCCETVSENLVDSIVSPTFYFGLLGIAGSIMFRCSNLMDAMWGYINDKYGRLGFFPAKFDDVLGWLTSRASPYFVALAALILRMNWRAVVPAAKEEHTKTPSPNSGWPMTAVSAALGISMEKKGVYVMGKGPMPTTKDVQRCMRLVELTSILFMLLICFPLFAFLGIHVQLWLEGFLLTLFL